MTTPASIVRYYAYCLTDSQSGRASVTRAAWHRQPYRRVGRRVIAEDSVSSWGSGANNPPSDLSLADLSSADIEAWAEPGHSWVPIVWHPFVFERSHAVRHGLQTHQWAPDVLVPISILLYAHRDGRIQVVGRPRFSRECLEPAAQGSLILGAVEEADRFYEAHPFPELTPPSHKGSHTEDEDGNPLPSEAPPSLAEVIQYAESLFESVCQADPHQPIPGVLYDRAAYGVAIPARQGSGAIDPLLKTYDAIETLEPDLPCFDRLLKPVSGGAPSTPRPLASQQVTLNRWGTLDSLRELSEDQELAIGACARLQAGEIQAIHGPPGTGKTAILQELVAHSVVKSVLQGQPPELIVIASTNNQAIRNALESLTAPTATQGHSHVDALLKRRWIEAWPSLGFYNAAAKAQQDAQKAGLPTLEDMERLERTVDTQALAMTFIQNARAITQSGAIASIASATEALSALLKAEAKEQIWASSLPRSIRKELSAPHLSAVLNALKEHEQRWRRRGWLTKDADIRCWQRLTNTIKGLLSVLTEYRHATSEMKRLSVDITQCWRSDWVLRLKRAQSFDGKLGELARRRIEKHYPDIASKIHERQALQLRLAEYKRTAQQQRHELLKGPLLEQWRTMADQVLHRKVRDRWFWIALHVREGQWLDCMNTTLRAGVPDGRKEEKMRALLYRRSLIAPVTIATLHRLPKVLSHWDVQRQAEIPLFNILDWLIVDEAGQCAPDVAAASASLTKRLAAIGDRAQLEPVWSLEVREDLGNRVASGLVKAGELNSEVSERITCTGGDASSGSLLHLAESSTAYADERLGPSGLWLTQHRRCLEPIFNVCNELAYEGKLQSARTAESVCPFPPLAYMDCPGVDRKVNGSRANGLEAVMIAQWVVENSDTLTHAYNRKLNEIVGIITPFKAQAELILQHLNASLGFGHSITVGTVHALQGAERPVILFSATYCALPQNRSLFFDQTTSMLNVAVSRAQDCFLVAGDTETLFGGGLPSRLLGQHIKRKGQRVDWPSFGTEDTLSPAWNGEIRRRFGSGSAAKTAEADNAAIKLLSEDAPSVIMAISELDRQGFEKIGNASLKAARKGCRVIWLLSHEYLLEHPESRAYLQALETLRNHGVTIQYTGPVASNLIILPEFNVSLWGERSWLVSDGPRRFIASSENADQQLARLRELHQLTTVTPEESELAGTG